MERAGERASLSQEDEAEFPQKQGEKANGFTDKEQQGEASLQSRRSVLVLSFDETAPTLHPGKDDRGAATSAGLQRKAGHLPFLLP